MSKRVPGPVCTCAVIEYGEDIYFCPLHKAAPDLLKVLEFVKYVCDFNSGWPSELVQQKVNEAIAKAKGKED